MPRRLAAALLLFGLLVHETRGEHTARAAESFKPAQSQHGRDVRPDSLISLLQGASRSSDEDSQHAQTAGGAPADEKSQSLDSAADMDQALQNDVRGVMQRHTDEERDELGGTIQQAAEESPSASERAEQLAAADSHSVRLHVFLF